MVLTKLLKCIIPRSLNVIDLHPHTNRHVYIVQLKLLENYT